MIPIVLAIILISLIFAPLGCIALWKRYVYFGDGLAHASFLAASISIIAHFPLVYSGMIIAIFFAIFVFIFKNYAGRNAAISLMSSFMLAVALMINYLNSATDNITNLLFGDIFLVSYDNLTTLVIILLIITIFIGYFYNQIILIVINRDIAAISGVRVIAIELTFLILLSLSVFSAIKIVGALMVTAILLIPAMCAKLFAQSPVQMIFISTIISILTNLCSIAASFYLDAPLTPIIIIIGTIIYVAIYIISFGISRFS